MSKIPILQPNHSYTFRSYFEMSFEPEDILAEFGYSLKRSSLNLQKSTIELDRLANLKSRMEESFALELIAIDAWTDSQEANLQGAVMFLQGIFGNFVY
ncbi:hypothetical protein [Nostoc sp. TCL240-02]|uniref:hypothetical protein n=1 Tax=Nostoc sp. TCL240-02 TaxID=2572090 RepID=UPI0034A005F4